LSFDLADALGRIKPQKISSLARRANSSLPFFREGMEYTGPPLLLDTCVYIDVLQRNAPSFLRDLLNARLCHHSAVCLAELTHVFGRLDPAHPTTATTLAKVRSMIQSEIRPTRLGAPPVESWGSAGILAGMLMRSGGYPKEREQACLNDALIFVEARRNGQAVLTRNVAEFDLLTQVLPQGRVLFYEAP
jgi:hypothetical protein